MGEGEVLYPVRCMIEDRDALVFDVFGTLESEIVSDSQQEFYWSIVDGDGMPHCQDAGKLKQCRWVSGVCPHLQKVDRKADGTIWIDCGAIASLVGCADGMMLTWDRSQS